MKFKTEIFNSGAKGTEYKAKNLNSGFKSSPSFTGSAFRAKNIAEDVLSQTGSKVINSIKDGKVQNTLIRFFKENFTEGVDVTYSNKEKILSSLKQNFGDTFEDCFGKIEKFNSLKNSKGKIIYTIDDVNDTITFHKDPFLKNVFDGIKEFSAGTILDIGVSARNFGRKITRKAPPDESRGLINAALDKRIAQKNAKDAFYKVSGVFEKIDDTVKSSNSEKDAGSKITEAVEELAKDSLSKASKKVGKYNTKSERAWNRLGTGFVSACFASTDFYNISMLQNNDPQKANESSKKRFSQDMRRQALTAGITYVVLGAFQNKVNKSILYAALSLGGVTLISEILSRVMGKIPLKPLTPEEAKKIAEKKEKEKEETQNIENNPLKNESGNKTLNTDKNPPQNMAFSDSNQSQNSLISLYPSNSINNTFKVFTDKIPLIKEENKNVHFGSNPDNQNTRKKKSNIGANILKGVLGVIGASLAVGFLRSKNVFKIDDAIKFMSEKYNAMADKLTTKRLVMDKKDVDSFLEYLNNNNFKKQGEELVKTLNLDKSASNYDLGFVESKGKKTLFTLLSYPFNTVNKLMQKGNNLVRAMFGMKAPVKEATEIQKKMPASSFIEKYANKYKKAVEKGDLEGFKNELQDAFTRHFSEANSQNKNTSVAMISRFLITLISGYFFVNDYRNEVLIESKGEDVERANATMKERIGHKIANFFLNSLFMDIFNTTFENIYLGSVLGATGVAMATEFTNETAVRASICTPTKRMNRDELIEYENERLNDPGLKGDYFRTFMKITGKKPLSAKVKQ